MKWIVQLDYKFGEFEPNSIYFRRVCSDDVEYSFGYDTKREALEAFCLGQVAIDELRKEREAEQKKEAEQKCGEICGDNRFEIIAEAKRRLLESTNIETSKEEMACLDSFLFRCWQMGWLKQYEPKEAEGWDKAIKEAKEKYGYGKPDFKVKVKSPTEESLDKIENRLTEVEGVLSSIGSPDYDLRKKVEKLEGEVLGDDGCVGLVSMVYDLRLHKDCAISSLKALEKRVEELEKKHRRLFKDYKTHLFASHNYTMTPKDMELIRQYEPEE